MTIANESTLVERPILARLTGEHGYRYIAPSAHPALRARENEVLFLPLLVDALVRINDIPRASAEAIAQDLAGIESNERWLKVLRGAYSRKLPGEDTHRTIRVIDLDRPENNDFACTNQLRVQGSVVRKPDVVIYVNGVPLVVIEAKSPLNTSQRTFDAIDQIRSAEREIPRLFYSNLFNIATNDITFLYGATGSPPQHWARWRDPWPRSAADFADETEKGLYALLDPPRLLDLLAHFVVFETRDLQVVKKICRYQQFRAVNKMVARVVEGKHRAGLVWHTQGSGKSLTMAFAALKLKFHRGMVSDRLQNPNLLVVTDRVDLHDQITGTFLACGLPNPTEAGSIDSLRALVAGDGAGRTVLSTIFKFHWEDEGLHATAHRQRVEALKALAIPGSERWILMVDEAHRTQEKDLGAYLRAILPHAVRFGFTGTPVRKGDKDTFSNFGAPGETYLDKYGIDDAVADGATVPIYYQGRMTEWHLHDQEVDALFDQWFANEPDAVLAELKARGVTKGDLARFQPRINLIAVDIWAHFREHVQPDGFKAQIVAIDRLACVAYKTALDKVIAQTLQQSEGLSEAEAHARATAMSLCVYSPGQHDGEQHPELVAHQLDAEEVRTRVLPDFHNPKHPLQFLIVCNKLLTGFDAPIEAVMYLDNPLTDHNLLQAIARTNRTYTERKKRGLIVDYIGVSKNLKAALSAYRSEDVSSAMRDEEELHDQLRAAHREVMALVAGVPRTSDVKADVKAVIRHLGTEDRWYVFRGAADVFLKAYGTLSPDPRVLPFQSDLKFVAAVLPYGRLKFEGTEETDWRPYSEKIRKMLNEHLKVTGLTTMCKLRSLSDPAFFADPDDGDLETAAVRKLAELKKETSERAARSPARYDKFSDRIKALIKAFQAGLIDAAKVLKEAEELAAGVLAEDEAHEESGLSRRAYDVAAILAKFKAPGDPPVAAEGGEGGYSGGKAGLTAVQEVAQRIDALYASDEQAPPYWQDKSELKKELRQAVRRMVQPLGLEGWQKEIPAQVEAYAVAHYSKP